MFNDLNFGTGYGLDIIKLMVESGANINAADVYGDTSLHFIIFTQQPAYCTDISSTCIDEGTTIFFLFFENEMLH